jgi:uncharacterized membrane protein YphA (DoxX/SURF4 family)
LLRSVAGGIAAIQGALYLTGLEEPTALSWAAGLLVIVSAIGLIAGFMTPGAATAVSLMTLFIAATWIPSNPASLSADRLLALLVVVDGVALAVLGPGAYSVDARLFGRREIVIPDD